MIFVVSAILSQIEHVYVVRRNWDISPHHLGHFAHSGILVRTRDQHYYLIEYTKKNFDTGGGAHAIPVTYTVLKTYDGYEDISCNGHTWTKQKTGKPYSGTMTVEEAKNKMNELMPEGYHVFKQEYCHTAQERLRQSMNVF